MNGVSAPIAAPSRYTTCRSTTSISTTSKNSSNLDRSWLPSISPNMLNCSLQSSALSSLDLGVQVHLQTCSITASKCISEFTRSRPPSASPNSLDHGLQMQLWFNSISASKCTSTLPRTRPPSAYLSSLNLGLQVHLQMYSDTVFKYIMKERQRVYGDTGVTEVDWATGSICTSSHFHLILSYNENTHSIFPNFWSHSLCPRFRGSVQLRGSSRPGSIIACHPLPALLKPEPLFLTNSIWMSREVRRSVDGGLSAF